MMADRLAMRRKRNMSMGRIYNSDQENIAKNDWFSSSMYWKLEVDMFYDEFFLSLAESLSQKWKKTYAYLEKEGDIFYVEAIRYGELHKNILMQLKDTQKIVFSPSDDMELLACMEGFHKKVSSIRDVEFIL